ncbi:MAG: conjugal transfer protein TraL [Acidobacteriaceae bacterium]|nr:conjugal transfer protein TraL [Acidobacteriaceae bacterium]
MPKSTPDAQPLTSAIHLSLQGKGGVGKSLVASILAQYFVENGRKVECIDTDPVNQTFLQYRALGARHIDLMRDGNIDQRGFDALMERLLTEDGVFVIDNGASTFIPLWSYILENKVQELLSAAGKNLYVHTVVTGGQALADTLKGFRSLAESTSERNVIVWVNEYFGRVERDGKQFIDMNAYKESVEKVFGWVHIVKRNQDTFGRDFEEVIARKLTLREAITDAGFSLMSKQRLKVIQRDLFQQIERLFAQ